MQLADRFTRTFYYCQKGLGLFTVFKDLILVIIAICFTLKLTSIYWMILMFCVALPILTCVGWFCVHRMDKITEMLQIKFGTHYQVRQFALYEEIRDLLKLLLKK